MDGGGGWGKIWIHFCVRQPDVGGSIDTLNHILNAHLNRVACPLSNYEKKLRVLMICCNKGFSSLLLFDKRINCNTHRVFCHIFLHLADICWPIVMPLLHLELRWNCYLQLWWSAFVSDKQEIRVSVYDDFLFESPAFRRLLLHVWSGEVAVYQGRFARRQRTHDPQPNVRHASRQRPFLAVDKRIWNKKEKRHGVINMARKYGKRCFKRSTTSQAFED